VPPCTAPRHESKPTSAPNACAPRPSSESSGWLRYEPYFFRLLELPEVLAVVDGYVADTAILHLQNGLILPPVPGGERADVFQTRFHRDSPRLVNRSVMSVNTFVAIDEFPRGTAQRWSSPEHIGSSLSQRRLLCAQRAL
jgi:hypothetical protein